MKNNIEIIKYNSLDHHELIIFGNCNINEKNKNKKIQNKYINYVIDFSP